MPKTKQNKSFANVNVSNLSDKAKLVLFVALFALLGGSFYVYQSFAATSIKTLTAADSELSITKDFAGTQAATKTTDNNINPSSKSAAVKTVGVSTNYIHGHFTMAVKAYSPSANTNIRVCAYARSNQGLKMSLLDKSANASVDGQKVSGSIYGYDRYCATKFNSHSVSANLPFRVSFQANTLNGSQIYLWKVTAQMADNDSLE